MSGGSPKYVEHRTEAQVENIVEMMHLGASREEIAKRLGVVPDTITTILDRHAVYAARIRARLTHEPGEHEHEWRDEGPPTRNRLEAGTTSTLLSCRWPFCAEIRFRIEEETRA